jgi:hypothetical protein
MQLYLETVATQSCTRCALCCSCYPGVKYTDRLTEEEAREFGMGWDEVLKGFPHMAMEGDEKD